MWQEIPRLGNKGEVRVRYYAHSGTSGFSLRLSQGRRMGGAAMSMTMAIVSKQDKQVEDIAVETAVKGGQKDSEPPSPLHQSIGQKARRAQS